MRKIFVVFLFMMLFAVLVARADTYALGQASTAGFANGLGTGQTPRGWDFVISQPILVTQLGVNAGVSGIPITLSLWDVTTQTLLAQTTAGAQAFTWEFTGLNTPLLLTPGDTFAVIGWADTAGAPWYIYNNDPAAIFNPVGIVTYLNGRFDNGIGANVFPIDTLGAPAQYGVVDIAYNTVPEPGTLALIGTGLGFIGAIRRKLSL